MIPVLCNAHLWIDKNFFIVQVPGKALNEKRTKKLPRMKTKEEILQGIATLGRSGRYWPVQTDIHVRILIKLHKKRL